MMTDSLFKVFEYTVDVTRNGNTGRLNVTFDYASGAIFINDARFLGVSRADLMNALQSKLAECKKLCLSIRRPRSPYSC